MSPQLFSASHQQAVLSRSQLPIPHLQATASGLKWQKTCHRMLLTLQIRQGCPQHQHPAALGVNRSLIRPGHQALKAASATAQPGRMLFGEASGDDHAPGVQRQRFIGERAPAQHWHSHVLQQFFRLGVAEVKGFIAGHRHRKLFPLGGVEGGEGIGTSRRSLQQRMKPIQVEMLFGEPGPLLLAVGLALEFMGRRQTQMTAGQVQRLIPWKASQHGHLDRSQNLSEQVPVSFSADTVEHDTGNAQFWIVITEPLHHSSQ